MKKKLTDFFGKSGNIRLFINTFSAILLGLIFVFLNNGHISRPLFTGCLFILIYVFIICTSAVIFRSGKKHGSSARKNVSDPVLSEFALDLLVNIYMPVAICNDKGKIIWVNNAFSDISKKSTNLYGEKFDDYAGVPISVISADENPEGVSVSAFDTEFRIRAYQIYLSGKEYHLTVWNDRTELKEAYQKLFDEETLVCYIMIDNLEELHHYAQEKTSDAASDVTAIIKNWASSIGAILKEYDREKFIMIFDAKYMEQFSAEKFGILDSVHEVRVGEGNLPVTVSIGIAQISGTLADKERAAASCLDMALQRGGDQAVIKTQDGMEFFGGRTKTVQKRTKVRARVVANELAAKMSKSSNVILMGHRNIDFDAIGACIGIARLAMFCGVRVNIIVNKNDENFRRCFEKLRSIPEYNGSSVRPVFIDPADAPDLVSPETLLIILDVNNSVQFELPEIADIAPDVVIIDHHRKSAEFTREPSISYIETSVSSTCELVSEILEQSLPVNSLAKDEADILYAGILLDTKQFTRNTGIRTFSAALYLRGEGANPADAQLLFKTDIDNFMSEARFESNVIIYRDVFAISVSDSPDNTNSDRINAAKAADKLLTVDNVQASFALCRIGEIIHVSARSSANINVQLILEKCGGGGHFNSAATQVSDKTMQEALDMLTAAIDEYLSEENQ